MLTLVGSLILATFLSTVVTQELLGRLLSRLRFEHPEIWKAIGSPSRFYDDFGAASTRALSEFARRTDYQEQCGKEVRRLVSIIRTCQRVSFVLAILSLVFGASYILTQL